MAKQAGLSILERCKHLKDDHNITINRHKLREIYNSFGITLKNARVAPLNFRPVIERRRVRERQNLFDKLQRVHS
jgi:hypothetical protein